MWSKEAEQSGKMRAEKQGAGPSGMEVGKDLGESSVI